MLYCTQRLHILLKLLPINQRLHKQTLRMKRSELSGTKHASQVPSNGYIETLKNRNIIPAVITRIEKYESVQDRVCPMTLKVGLRLPDFWVKTVVLISKGRPNCFGAFMRKLISFASLGPIGKGRFSLMERQAQLA